MTQAGQTKNTAKTKTNWHELEVFVLAQLEDGPKTTRQLKELGESAGWTADQIGKVIATRWMDLPRHPGQRHYDPWTIYHPFSPHVSRLGIGHGIDAWLVEWMSSRNGQAVASNDVRKAAESAGFTPEQLVTAYRRCGIVAQKMGHHWYRRLTAQQLGNIRRIQKAADQ